MASFVNNAGGEIRRSGCRCPERVVTTPHPWLRAALFAVGLSLEASRHLAGTQDGASEPESALALVDPVPWHMPLRKWSTLYVKTHLERVVAFRLVERLHADGAAGTEWTAVDATRRVQVVNLRNRALCTMWPQRGVKYTPMVGLSSKERRVVEASSWDVVRRAGGDIGTHPGKYLVLSPPPTFG